MNYITILGLDPGKANFAFSVVKVMIAKPSSFKVVETGMVENTVKDLTAVITDEANAFKKEIRAILRKHKVDVIVAERYMNRGRFGGNTGEVVNIMIGLLVGLPVLDIAIIPAAQWKNSFNKKTNLEEVYKASSLVAHRVDATNIALYGASMYLDSPAFEFLPARLNNYIQQMDNTR